MRDNKVKRRLFIAILVMTGVPLAASFYFLDAALRRSLDLGFNPQVVRALDIGAANLKALKDVDPANEEEYRRRFDEISMLRHVYAQPDVLKRTVYDSLRLYFGYRRHRRRAAGLVRGRDAEHADQSLLPDHVRRADGATGSRDATCRRCRRGRSSRGCWRTRSRIRSRPSRCW